MVIVVVKVLNCTYWPNNRALKSHALMQNLVFLTHFNHYSCWKVRNNLSRYIQLIDEAQAYWDDSCVELYRVKCKSLWIRASAKWLNVNQKTWSPAPTPTPSLHTFLSCIWTYIKAVILIIRSLFIFCPYPNHAEGISPSCGCWSFEEHTFQSLHSSHTHTLF